MTRDTCPSCEKRPETGSDGLCDVCSGRTGGTKISSTKQTYVHFRVTEGEKASLIKKAEDNGRTLSDYLRWKLLLEREE